MNCKTGLIFGVAIFLALFSSATAGAEEFFFHDGDAPILFLGDSITQQNRHTVLIESYLLTRYPKWHLSFLNAGWNSDTAWFQVRGDFESALKRDVLSRHPKVVLVDFGMNDARQADAYWKHLEYTTRIIKEVKAIDARVAILSPNATEGFDLVAPAGNPHNQSLRHFAAGDRTIAMKLGVPFVDNLEPYIKFIEAGRKAGVLPAISISIDGIHPNWAGSLILATLILKGLGATDLVSRCEIDAASQQVVQTAGCLITMLDAHAETNSAEIVFRRTDEALPWPLPVDALPALKIPGFNPYRELDRYELKITGLAASQYNLLIDDKLVGRFSREELTAGVNLAPHKSVITDQASQLLPLIIEKNANWIARWRNVELFEPPDWLKGPKFEELRQAEMNRLDDRNAALEKNIEKLRQPVPHIFKLLPALIP